MGRCYTACIMAITIRGVSTKLRIRNLLYSKPLIYLAAFLLWAATGVLAIWEITLVRAASQRLLTRYFASHGSPSTLLAGVRADPFSKVVALIMTALALVIVVGGFDYHLDHAGKRRSWRLFAWTLGVQLALLLLSYLL